MKKILILGSTGSIGVSSLDVVRNLKDEFTVTGLSANGNIDLLERQINEFGIKYVCVRNEEKAAALRQRTSPGVKVLSGDEGLLELAATLDYDILIGAMVGFSGLLPTIEAIKRGKRIALANKETLVAAGEFVDSLVKKHGAEILPVDSEHSAIFQCLTGESAGEIKRIILTASGGPFFRCSREELQKVSIAQALAHPTWKMGSKITIDSATLMNKGLEVIEAHWLFDVPADKIDVVIHPQSVIHSMVEFTDGSVKAQLSKPDMKLPIQYALTYPERRPADFVENNFMLMNNLTFHQPDKTLFECLQIAFDVLEEGGTSACIANAANEIAVEKFLNGQIGFMDIPNIIKSCLSGIPNHKAADLETIVETDRQTRILARELK